MCIRDSIRTEQDFVEAPSQMLEEWMKSPEVLATFAKHYQTNEAIPAELVKRMNRANACYDKDPKGVDSDGIFSGFIKKYQPFPFVEGTHFQCAFGHLNGYSAVYY